MTYTRRISSKGGITIPQRLRHEAGLIPGMAVDIVAIPGRYSTEISSVSGPMPRPAAAAAASRA